MKDKKKIESTDAKQVDEKKPFILVAIGIGLLIFGFIVLSKVNRMATNWAGFAAPALLLAGWIIIAVGLWKGEK